MYRICLARSGSFYVQERRQFGWSKIGGFFITRAGARNFARRLRNGYSPVPNRVVEYV